MVDGECEAEAQLYRTDGIVGEDFDVGPNGEICWCSLFINSRYIIH